MMPDAADLDRATNRERVSIVPTGIANLEAIAAAFRRLGLGIETVATADDIGRANYLVLPGVGSFSSGMAALESNGWSGPLRERVEDGRPTLAICLGLQLLCERSEEAPDIAGLGCIPGSVTRFGGDVRVPQLGWNQVRAHPKAASLRTAVMYFANSYRLRTPPAGWTPAIARYGGPFVAAIERGAVVACQFHPELSGIAGRGLLKRWLQMARGAVPC